MKLAVAVLICCAALLAGCNSTGSGSTHVSMYGGVGYYDPWGWGPCCYNVGVVGPPVVVAPRPPGAAPPRPSQPMARPPAAPRPAARGGGGRR